MFLSSKVFQTKRKCWHLNGKATSISKCQRNSTNIPSQWPRQLGSNSSWATDGGSKSCASKWHESPVRGLGAMPCRQPCFFPACVEKGSQLSEKADCISEQSEVNHPWVSRSHQRLIRDLMKNGCYYYTATFTRVNPMMYLCFFMLVCATVFNPVSNLYKTEDIFFLAHVPSSFSPDTLFLLPNVKTCAFFGISCFAGEGA